MAWQLWTGGALGVLVIAALALRVAGAQRWANLMRRHTGQLEAARLDGKGRAPGINPPPARFDARELEGLPMPVQRYFQAVLKDGQPMVAAASIEMNGTINMSATGEQWKPFVSKQRVVTRRPGFLWDAQVGMFPGVPAQVEDSYIAGQGRLVAKLLGLFTVVSVHGGGEVARGEFMRWFAEAAWVPTALLPSQGVRWTAVDDVSAHASITDGPITLTLLFRFNDTGLIDSVRAESRGAAVGTDMVGMPWECGFSDYQTQSDMLVPMAGEATWIRPEGRKCYFLGKVTSLKFEFLP
jgi:hypothetical protein